MPRWRVSLPVEARASRAATGTTRRAGQAQARWMRGGFWRSFPDQLPEITTCTSRCCVSRQGGCAAPRGAGQVSDVRLVRIANPPLPGPVQRLLLARALRGIYLSTWPGHAGAPHPAEDAADRAAGWRRDGEVLDLDIDGYGRAPREHAGPGRPSSQRGWRIGSWDARASRHALTSVMRRPPGGLPRDAVAADTGESRSRRLARARLDPSTSSSNEPGTRAALVRRL